MKKYVSLLIVFLVLLSVQTAVFGTDGAVTVIGIKVTDINGSESLTAVLETDTVRAEYEFKNSGEEQSVTLILAAYSENRLAGCSLKQISVPNGGGTFSAELSGLSQMNMTEGATIKAMVMDSMQKLFPLAKVYPISLSDLTKRAEDFAATNGAPSANTMGIRWGRAEFYWSDLQPTPLAFNEAKLEEWKQAVLDCKSGGLTPLVLLAYTAPWAASSEPYSYDCQGYHYDFAKARMIIGDDQNWTRVLTKTNLATGEVTTETKTISKSVEPFADVNAWKAYVEKVVSALSAPPYNLKYFQIWNEAHPLSSFFNGDLEWYIENIHKPAAEIIRKYGCYAVYGGWPDCGSLDEWFALLDKTNAWSYIDVFDTHYLASRKMEEVYNAARARGVISPCVWQTETGFTTNTKYIASNFTRMLYWSLQHRSDKAEQFKQFYFTYWSPNDPNAFGYGTTLLSGDALSDHGLAMKTFLEHMQGENVSRYTAISTSTGMKFDMATMESIQAINVDNKRIEINICTAKTANIAGMKIYLNGIYNVQSVTAVDAWGKNAPAALSYTENSGAVTVTVPANYPDRYSYITVTAERIMPAASAKRDFECGACAADNTSIICGGRFSYLDSSYSPLTAADEPHKWLSERGGYIEESGTVSGGTGSVCYNYTIGQSGMKAVASGAFTPTGGAVLRIYRTRDKAERYVGNAKELIYTSSGNNSQTFSIELADAEIGNDIIFEVTGNAETDFNVEFSPR